MSNTKQKKTNKISVVVNTLNEEKNIEACLRSVSGLADEIVVVDMYSEDKTRTLAKKMGAKVFLHKKMGYVEPARNFAINKATGKWILILDADEKITPLLKKRLKEIVKKNDSSVDYVLIPRKNIILGKWIQNSRWWPDYLPRFFKKGKVKWPKQIHQKPDLTGNILTLPDVEKLAIVHCNYETLDQYLQRAVRYAEVQADELIKEKSYQLATADLVLKPLGELMSRFFAGEGYKDGFHGLVLAVLQAYSKALVYLKVWEKQKYEEKPLESKKIKEIFSQVITEIDFWLNQYLLSRVPSGIKKEFLKLVFRLKKLILSFF